MAELRALSAEEAVFAKRAAEIRDELRAEVQRAVLAGVKAGIEEAKGLYLDWTAPHKAIADLNPEAIAAKVRPDKVEPHTLLVVRNDDDALALQRVVGGGVMVAGHGSAMGGRRFENVIVLARSDRRHEITDYERNYWHEVLSTKLPPGKHVQHFW